MAPAPLTPVQAITATGYVPATAPVPSTDGSAFASALTAAVDNVQALSGASDTLSLKAASGNLDDIHDATIASTRAAVSLELVAAVRNKGVDAFNEIMRMQA
ncbi:flagellar hook-basal body complex protein FliE [Arthrobacter crusticola]|uniref:Flagellar hook-basal body complex protein FliE n=1 Tax=Arthrobacter crusticola TaxID=2547960 RepID=A0A4R5TX73_9MICC|nr:flagellar hook-basal body complex protein FliE [Arthrobacter crusticola]TDK25786.1 flagellar hook-basal body complex protein FliE [Arthrobacter crusticola]